MHKSSYSKMIWFKNSFLSDKKHIKILDVGSLDKNGDYNYKSIFNEPDWEYTGLDIEDGNNVDIVVEDIYDWEGIDDNTYDVVISGQFFEHIKLIWKVMSEIKRVLKPGGYVCIITPSAGPDHGNLKVYNRFNTDDLTDLAALFNFEIIHTSISEVEPWHDACLVAFNKNSEIESIQKELSLLKEEKKALFNFKQGLENLNAIYQEKSGENLALKNEISKLNSDFINYKKTTDEILDSYNYLFETIFLDYELNNTTPILNNIQTLCTELLAFVGNVCKKHDMEWWLDCGNALGAVRHGYFVPWDDDVDIGMIRKDYMKFDAIFKKEVKNYKLNDIIKIKYKQRKIDDKKIDGFVQIFLTDKLKGKKAQILAGVDIFPYDFLNDYKDMETLDELYYQTRIKYHRNISKKLDLEDCVNQYYEDLNLSFEKSKYVIPGVEGPFGKRNLYKLVVFETDKVYPLANAKYGDKVFPCANDLEYYVKKIYGNYLNLPKSLRRHTRVQNLKYTMDEFVFQKNILRLQSINATFDDNY